jgi:hypothetical protein
MAQNASPVRVYQFSYNPVLVQPSLCTTQPSLYNPVFIKPSPHSTQSSYNPVLVQPRQSSYNPVLIQPSLHTTQAVFIKPFLIQSSPPATQSSCNQNPSYSQSSDNPVFIYPVLIQPHSSYDPIPHTTPFLISPQCSSYNPNPHTTLSPSNNPSLIQPQSFF